MTSISLRKRPRFTRSASMQKILPSSPACTCLRSSFTAGLYSNVCPTISTRCLMRASSTSSSASATLAVSGFSTSTCLPASSACFASV